MSQRPYRRVGMDKDEELNRERVRRSQSKQRARKRGDLPPLPGGNAKETEANAKANGYKGRREERRAKPGYRVRATQRLEGKMAQLYAGEISVEDMDIEELQRMQFRDVHGGFRGRAPSNIPGVLINRMRRELFKRGDMILTENWDKLQEALIDLALNADVKTSDRIAAIKTVMERVRGKVPDKVEMSTGESPFEVTVANAIRRLPEDSGDDQEDDR